MNSDIEQTYDIVIVGGGMVGATLACALAKTRYKVAVVEGQSIGQLAGAYVQRRSDGMVDRYDQRVSALTVASQRFMENLGVWSRMVSKRVSPYQQMKVWDGEGTASIEFSAAELYQPALGHIVENSVTIAALYEQLRADETITLLTGELIHQVDLGGDCPKLTLASGLRLNASLVVAADGANSLIRTVAGLPTREWDYQHHAIVATVKTSKKNEETAWQRFMATGPLAFLPLATEQGDSHYSSIVWSATPARADELMALDDEPFCEALASGFEHRLGDVQEVSTRHRFPLRQRHAKQYVTANIALVGDAAHTIHPLAGQGVNLGLQDVAVLADELIRASARGLAANDTLLLKRYQRRRITPNLAMMGLMEGFKRLFAQEGVGARLLRNTGMRWLNESHFLKNQIVSQAMGLDLKVPER